MTDIHTGDETFDAYSESLTSGETPLLGHLILYAISDGEVTVDELTDWFDELSLDPRYLPPSLRQVDAYERVTGPGGVRTSYPLDDSAPTTANTGPPGSPPDVHASGPGGGGGRRRRAGDASRSAALMIRPVRRDGGEIERHLVREVRDGDSTRLSYDVHLASVIFRRDNNAGSHDGDGTLHIEPDEPMIASLDPFEQTKVRELLAELDEQFRARCLYLTGDRLRKMIRDYLEDLKAIRVRPTGGVYFLHRQHAPVLAALRELVSRFGDDSDLSRIPLADQQEMRDMVIKAFTTKTKDDLDKLAADIATARREGRLGAVEKLYQRFAELQQATDEHSLRLETSLEDTQASLALVKLQLGSLLTGADPEPSTTAPDAPESNG